MTSSKEPIGRRGFVLRILSVTALGLAFELLSRANSPIHTGNLPFSPFKCHASSYSLLPSRRLFSKCDQSAVA